MKEIIRLEPVFKQMVWGGSGSKDHFGLKIPGEDTGEAWVVSAHPQGDCSVAEGRFAKKTLSRLWKEHRELFGDAEGEEFPLLVKFIDAKEDLSIQVHPDDAYAKVHENGARGNPRDLHLAQAMDVIGCPYTEDVDRRETFHEEGYDRTFLVSCPFYTVEKYDIQDTLSLEQDQPFLLLCVIEGEGTIDKEAVKMGDCMLLPAGYGVAQIQGALRIVTVHI